MRTDDFDYNLPEELIAQAPAEPRDSCRLLVVDRKGSETGTPLGHGGTVEHRIFRDIIDYIEPGDVLVINQTRVMPARLIGRKTGSGGVGITVNLGCRGGLLRCSNRLALVGDDLVVAACDILARLEFLGLIGYALLKFGQVGAGIG